MAKTFVVDFTITLGTCREVAAETEEEAYEIARKLLKSDAAYEDLVESWDSSDSWAVGPNLPKVLTSYEDGEPSYTDEQLRLFGVEV